MNKTLGMLRFSGGILDIIQYNILRIINFR